MSDVHCASSVQSSSLPEMPEIDATRPGTESQADEDFSVAQYPSAEVHVKERMMVVSGIADEKLLSIDAPHLLFEKMKDPEHEGVHHVQFFPQDEAYTVCVRYNNAQVNGGSFRLLPGRMQNDDIAEKQRANALWRIPIPFTGIAFQFGFTSVFLSRPSISKRKRQSRRVHRRKSIAADNTQTRQRQPSGAHTNVDTPAMGSSHQAPAVPINTQSVHSTPRRFYSSTSGEKQPPRVVVCRDPDMPGPRCRDQDDELDRLLSDKRFVDEGEFDAEEQDIEELGVDMLEA